jgi:5-methylcytosine-specific restriction endonuclease McrA
MKRWKSGWQVLTCLNCQYPFQGMIYPRPSLTMVGQKPPGYFPVFCSRSCMAVFELRERYAPRFNRRVVPVSRRGWEVIAKRIRHKDGYRCQACGKVISFREACLSGRANLSVDHIIPLALVNEHHDVNLITVCEPCHRSKTGFAGFGFEQKLRKGDIPGFLKSCRQFGWPVERVRVALRHYGLPAHPCEWRRVKPMFPGTARDKAKFRYIFEKLAPRQSSDPNTQDRCIREFLELLTSFSRTPP